MLISCAGYCTADLCLCFRLCKLLVYVAARVLVMRTRISRNDISLCNNCVVYCVNLHSHVRVEISTDYSKEKTIISVCLSYSLSYTLSYTLSYSLSYTSSYSTVYCTVYRTVYRTLLRTVLSSWTRTSEILQLSL